ncbi:MAG: hypothetical protein ACE5PV_26905, partial [Candidatus Poribacteria bacterium]
QAGLRTCRLQACRASGPKRTPPHNSTHIVKNTIRQNKRYGICRVDVKTEDVKGFLILLSSGGRGGRWKNQ